jgi:hypothetical protein
MFHLSSCNNLSVTLFLLVILSHFHWQEEQNKYALGYLFERVILKIYMITGVLVINNSLLL